MRGRPSKHNMGIRTGRTQHNLDNAPGLPAQVQPGRPGCLLIPIELSTSPTETTLKKHFTRWSHSLRALESTPPRAAAISRQLGCSILWQQHLHSPRPTRPFHPLPPTLPPPVTSEMLISEPRRTKRPRKPRKRKATWEQEGAGSASSNRPFSLGHARSPPYCKRAWLAASLPLVVAWA